ncbi:polarity establishment/cellular polarization [Marasmius crinis-equi]|uniref:Polarity establishment/cellular polarization n=1 Tax=Marasmius crinis-equi TaxID=585013 RepID=A0ABR3FKY3_9AGAR
MFLLSFVYFLIAASAFTSAKITVNIPLDNQLPLIARVGQYYNWTFSPNTFTSTTSISRYTSSPLAGWLSFDPTTLSLYGTPKDEDQGFPDVTITAHDSESSESSWFNIYVTDAPPPALNVPLEKQFQPGNPALSSVFVPSPNSALAHTNQPTLRIPFRWSFSIGFLGSTFTQEARYDVLQSDGSPLPPWIKFSHSGITLDGNAPHQDDPEFFHTLHLSLHATDRQGYTASTVPFTILLADHELCMTGTSLPTINITAGDSFSFQLNSGADFAGVQVDGKDIQPSDIFSIAVDVGGNDWLGFNSANRTFSGQTTADTAALPLPAVINAYNQTLNTTIPVAIVASFFNYPDFGTYEVGSDGKVVFDLRDHLSNATDGTANLSAAFDPPEAASYLHLDDERLTGTLPDDFPSASIVATFAAYSTTTHSTSHATLHIHYDAPKADPPTLHPVSEALSSNHKKLILALSITFGIVGGICALACLLAVCRHVIKEKDTALEGEEGRRGWTEKEKEYYGITEEKVGYGWTDSADEHRTGLDLPRSPLSPRSPPHYGNIGLGLHRVMERSQSDENQVASNSSKVVDSPGFIKKKEFMAKVRDTVRNVSDKYARVKRPSISIGRRHGVAIENIGKPILLHRTQSSSLRNQAPSSPSTNPSGRTPIESVATPTAVHFAPRLTRHGSSSSRASSIDSIEAHANEALVQTATRTPSFTQQTPIPTRPRLVPFMSSTRVPIPQMSITSPDPSDGASSIASARVTSQTAATNMWKEANDPQTPAQSGSGDDLSVGIHYVRALGADQAVEADPSTLTVSTNWRSSFSSLDSSNNGHSAEGKALRMIVRVGEQFKFRVPLLGGGDETRELEAKLTSGKRLPGFLRVDLGDGTGAVEFYGLPGVKDVGDLDVRICAKGDREGLCLARVLLQIVKRS